MKYLLTKIEYLSKILTKGNFYNCHADKIVASQFSETLKRVQGDIEVEI